MSPREIASQAINQRKILQLATTKADTPWIVTVHFLADEAFNLYWISRMDRRHSQEIRGNAHAAATILVHENVAGEDWVTAITISGEAEELDGVDARVAKAYLEKLDKKPEEVESAASGQGQARFYRLKPNQISLFDNKNFPEEPKQIITF